MVLMLITRCAIESYLLSVAVGNSDRTVSEDDVLHCDRLLGDHYRSGALLVGGRGGRRGREGGGRGREGGGGREGEGGRGRN